MLMMPCSRPYCWGTVLLILENAVFIQLCIFLVNRQVYWKCFQNTYSVCREKLLTFFTKKNSETNVVVFLISI